MTTQKELSHAEQNAKGWLETIREQLACLECDRERLEELRDEWETLKDAATDATEERDSEYKAGADSERLTELNDAVGEANEALKEWQDENAEELADLESNSKIDGEECDEEKARERIEESPLSVEVRDGWKSPGADSEGPEEFCILLSTGGPALRIRGDLDMHCQPTRAYMQYQDWGTPWTDYFESGIGDLLLQWASVFYFGG